MVKPSSEMEKQFCENVINGMNGTRAAIEAGFSEKSATTQAYQMRKKYEDFIAEGVVSSLKGKGNIALKVLVKLAQKAKQESVQLKAATSLLNYGGFRPAEKQEITVTQRSEEEIDAQLAVLLGDKAGDVLGTKH